MYFNHFFSWFFPSRLKRFCVLLFLLLFQVKSFAQYSNLPTLGDSSRDELSPQLEYKIGTEIMRMIKSDPDYIEDDVITEYVNEIGYRLVNATPEVRVEGNSYFFFTVRDSTLNAFALPGGFIAVHTGLLLATQSESELASVLSHEIGHVSQRHIARMIGNQKRDMLIPIASMILGAIVGVAAKNSNAAGAMIVGGQGIAIQKQLNFTREAERESDRVGFQILRNAGFDTNGMELFFERLQKANRNYNEGFSAYLRTHPLTSERIADAHARNLSVPYRQHADSVDFYLVRVRARLLQDTSEQATYRAEEDFKNMIKIGARYMVAAGNYGLALIALRRQDIPSAQKFFDEAKQVIGEKAALKSHAITSTSIDIKVAAKQYAEAIKETKAALTRFPASHALMYQYADILTKAKQYDKAIEYLRKQTRIYRNDALLYGMMAKIYNAQNKIALMHIALAESYSLSGGTLSALQQLSLARQAPDVTFYDHSVIDGKERELQERRKEELEEKE